MYMNSGTENEDDETPRPRISKCHPPPRGLSAKYIAANPDSAPENLEQVMVVSLMQFRVELPPLASIKDKRRIVSSIKEKLRVRFRLAVAEVDLQDSMSLAQIGAAYVSNSKQFGESVLQKALRFVESHVEGRLGDAQIFSEIY